MVFFDFARVAPPPSTPIDQPLIIERIHATPTSQTQRSPRRTSRASDLKRHRESQQKLKARTEPPHSTTYAILELPPDLQRTHSRTPSNTSNSATATSTRFTRQTTKGQTQDTTPSPLIAFLESPHRPPENTTPYQTTHHSPASSFYAA